MATKFYKLDATDAMEYINLTREVGYLQIDSPGKQGYIKPYSIEKFLSNSECMVLSQLPKKYASQAKGKLEGIIIDKETDEDKLVYNFPDILLGYVDSCDLYINYPCIINISQNLKKSERAYKDRLKSDLYDKDKYVINKEYNTITFTEALPEGSSIFADVTTLNCSWCQEIKIVIIKAAVGDILHSAGSISDRLALTAQRYSQDAYGFISRLAGKNNDGLKIGISSIESIGFLQEAQARGGSMGLGQFGMSTIFRG